MVTDARSHETEDKERRELVELKNRAENLQYQMEKLVKENKDKLAADTVTKPRGGDEAARVGALGQRQGRHPERDDRAGAGQPQGRRGDVPRGRRRRADSPAPPERPRAETPRAARPPRRRTTWWTRSSAPADLGARPRSRGPDGASPQPGSPRCRSGRPAIAAVRARPLPGTAVRWTAPPSDMSDLAPDARAFQAFLDAQRAAFLEREAVLEQLALALLAREHVLLTGPPGTAKSALAHAVLGRHRGGGRARLALHPPAHRGRGPDRPPRAGRFQGADRDRAHPAHPRGGDARPPLRLPGRDLRRAGHAAPGGAQRAARTGAEAGPVGGARAARDRGPDQQPLPVRGGGPGAGAAPRLRRPDRLPGLRPVELRPGREPPRAARGRAPGPHPRGGGDASAVLARPAPGAAARGGGPGRGAGCAGAAGRRAPARAGGRCVGRARDSAVLAAHAGARGLGAPGGGGARRVPPGPAAPGHAGGPRCPVALLRHRRPGGRRAGRR